MEGNRLDQGHDPFIRKTYAEALSLAQRAYGCLSLSRHRSSALPLAETDRLMYTAEIMRLSTKIMYALSWLMSRRAVEAGDLKPEDALADARRLGQCPAPGAAARIDPDIFPRAVRDLHGDADRLYQRVARLEADLLTQARRTG